MAPKGFNSLITKPAFPALLVVLLFTSMAKAEGFICHSVDQDARIDVYFDPADPAAGRGPRARSLVISDPMVSAKRSLVAQFDAADGVLVNEGSVVTAYVDLTNPKSSRRGEKIGGTVLGALKSILIDIDYSYQESVQDGTRFSAMVVYTKVNGDELVQDFDCVRYRDAAKMAYYVQQRQGL